MEIGGFTYGHGYIRPKFEDSGQPLVVGKFCSIAEDVVVFLGGEHRADWGTTYPFGEIFTNEFKEAAPEGMRRMKGGVTIGNDVWIGYGVTIMSGVTIADGAVIAANSHVIKDVGPYEMWGGNPATFIKKRFSDEVIAIMMEARWWDRSPEVINRVIPYLQKPFNLQLAEQVLSVIKEECGNTLE